MAGSPLQNVCHRHTEDFLNVCNVARATPLLSGQKTQKSFGFLNCYLAKKMYIQENLDIWLAALVHLWII